MQYQSRHTLLLLDLGIVLQQEIREKFYRVARSTHHLSENEKTSLLQFQQDPIAELELQSYLSTLL